MELTSIFDIALVKKIVVSTIIFTMLFSSAMVFTLIPKRAEAFLGIGDFNFNIEIGNIMETAWKILQKHLLKFLNGLLKKIVNFAIGKFRGNYLIQNYLRYEAVLTRRKHLDDYTSLYFPGVGNTKLRGFIYEYVEEQNSGGKELNENLKSYLDETAQGNLGFNVDELDPKSPDYLDKMSRYYSPLTNPAFLYFAMQDASLKAEAEAKSATGYALTSDGYKQEFQPPEINDTFQKNPSGSQYIDQLNKDLINAPLENAPPEESFVDQVISKTSQEFESMSDATYQTMFDKVSSGGGGDGTFAIVVADMVGSILDGLLYEWFSKRDKASRYVYNEFTDFLRPDVNPLRDVGNLESKSQTPDNPALPEVPDFCKAAVTGSAETDLGAGSATGGAGGVGGTGDIDPITGEPIAEGGAGGEGGEVEIDLNDGTIQASEGTDPCAEFSPQNAQDLMYDALLRDPDNQADYEYNTYDPNYGEPPFNEGDGHNENTGYDENTDVEFPSQDGGETP